MVDPVPPSSTEGEAGYDAGAGLDAPTATVDGGEGVAGGPGEGLCHPALPLMRKYLRKSAEARAAGQVLLAGVVAPTVASAAKLATLATGSGDTASEGACEAQASCVDAIIKLPPPAEAGLAELWLAIADEEQPLAALTIGMEEVEELVLAHLCEYPPFLTDLLLDAPLHQIATGQGIMAPGDRQIDIAEVSKRLAPCLDRHRSTATKIASETCSHLLRSSETMAAKLFNRLDLDSDGVVSRDEFLRAVPHALALEVENVAIGAGVQALLKDPEYADDFHTAMAGGMGIVP